MIFSKSDVGLLSTANMSINFLGESFTTSSKLLTLFYLRVIFKTNTLICKRVTLEKLWETGHWSFVFLKPNLNIAPAWKVSKFQVFSGPYFPGSSLHTGKYGQEKTLYLDSFLTMNPGLDERKLETLQNSSFCSNS